MISANFYDLKGSQKNLERLKSEQNSKIILAIAIKTDRRKANERLPSQKVRVDPRDED